MPARNPRTLLIGLLLLTLALTPWLSFWTTPLLARTTQGETVVLCTLQGLKTVQLDRNGVIANTDADSSDWHCPALQLAKLFNQTTLPDLLVMPVHPQPRAQTLVDSSYTYTVPHLSVYVGRAPPRS
ncbi:MAG: hypothetical protein R3E95_19980 [Thiolinea sp.]